MNLVDSSGWLKAFADGPNIPMADSIILSTGRLYQATVWTQDADFEGLDGVEYIRKRI